MKKLNGVILLLLLQISSAFAVDMFKADKLYKEGKYTDAKQEYLAAAELGNPHAYYQLAKMYFKGLGGEKDLIEALKYFSLAAEYNFPNTEQVINQILARLPEETQIAVINAMKAHKAKYGKQAIDNKLFPVVNQATLSNKITFEGKEKLEHKYYGDDFHAETREFAAFMLETSGVNIETPKMPFLILDVDVAKDGSIRHYSEVQKYADPLNTQRLLDDYVLFPVAKPEFNEKQVDFIHRVYMGAATYDKFFMHQENENLYAQIRRTAMKLKDAKTLDERYQYAMALLNFPWLEQAEGEAEKLLLEVAKLGHPGAMYEYGLMLYREQRNIADAVYWIGQASKYGLTRAEYRLAKILQSSPWVENDEKKALFWYQQAAKKEHIQALIRATEIKLTAKDETIKDLQGAIENLAYLEDKHKNNPEYYYLVALSYMNKENRAFKKAVSNLRTAIFKGQMANWDVTEWQDLLMKFTTGNVTIQDHS